jgi:hypothetical protein
MEENMSFVDPKGSRQELEAMAIIAHRAKNPPLAPVPHPLQLSVALAPQLIVLLIPGFWKSYAHHRGASFHLSKIPAGMMFCCHALSNT